MELTSYAARLQRDLWTVGETGTEETAAVAERLASVLDSSVRVVLLDALVEAAAEISDELAPGSIEVRLRGRDVSFAVTPGTAPAPAAPAVAAPATPMPPADEDDADGGTARLSLRLPERLKPKVEQAAAAAGLSVNAWLVRSIGALVEAPAPPPPPVPPTSSSGQRHTGWAR